MENYTMIIWMNNFEDSFEEEVDRAYKSLLEIDKIEHIAPKYLTTYSLKEKGPNFEVTRENTEKQILENRDKDYPELGSVYSFYSSEDKKKMSGIMYVTGNRKTNFSDSLVIDIINLGLSQDTNSRNEIIELFKKLILINKAYYACITDFENIDIFESYYDTKLADTPTSIFWINYWGEKAINKFKEREIDIDIIKNDVFQLDKFEKGYYVRLTETPILRDEYKLELQRLINRRLKL